METENINWARLRKTLLQEKNTIYSPEQVDKVLEHLLAAVGLCGEYSHSRKMIFRIAKIILSNSELLVLVPVCPDYSHEQGKYTFRALNGGVSLLTEKHILFLERLAVFLPKMKAMFLLADHEADDKEICRAVKKTSQEFLELVGSSLKETKERVASCGWNVKLMTEAIPDLVKREDNVSRIISGNSELCNRIKKEAMQRWEMYFKINRSFSEEEILQRTIRTAAQYVVMGEFAVEQRSLLCNHTTTNLSWYLQTNAGVLHNPVCIY